MKSCRRLAIGNAPITPTDASVAVIAVQPEQQRADRVVAGLVHAVARDHAVGGALMLDLEHHPLVRLIGPRQRFGDHAVEAGALELVEPPLGGRQVGGGRA